MPSNAQSRYRQIPVELTDPLQHRRVGIIEKNIEGMRPEIAQVVDGEFFQGSYHRLGILGGLCRKLIRCGLVSARQHLHEDADEKIER